MGAMAVLRVIRGAGLALRGIRVALSDGAVASAYRRFGLGYLAILGTLTFLSSLILLLLVPLALLAAPALLIGAVVTAVVAAIGTLAMSIAPDAVMDAVSDPWTIARLRPIGAVLGLWPSCAFFVASLVFPKPGCEFAVLGTRAAMARSGPASDGDGAKGAEAVATRLRDERKALRPLHATAVTLTHALAFAILLTAVRAACARALPPPPPGEPPANVTSDASDLAPPIMHEYVQSAAAFCVGAFSTGVQAVRVHLQSNRGLGFREQLGLLRSAVPEIFGFGLILQALMGLPYIGSLAGLGLGAYASGHLQHQLGDRWLYATPAERPAARDAGRPKAKAA
jgi:hypothetical protein